MSVITVEKCSPARHLVFLVEGEKGIMNTFALHSFFTLSCHIYSCWRLINTELCFWRYSLWFFFFKLSLAGPWWHEGLLWEFTCRCCCYHQHCLRYLVWSVPDEYSIPHLYFSTWMINSVCVPWTNSHYNLLPQMSNTFGCEWFWSWNWLKNFIYINLQSIMAEMETVEKEDDFYVGKISTWYFADNRSVGHISAVIPSYIVVLRSFVILKKFSWLLSHFHPIMVPIHLLYIYI